MCAQLRPVFIFTHSKFPLLLSCISHIDISGSLWSVRPLSDDNQRGHLIPPSSSNHPLKLTAALSPHTAEACEHLHRFPVNTLYLSTCDTTDCDIFTQVNIMAHTNTNKKCLQIETCSRKCSAVTMAMQFH